MVPLSSGSAADLRGTNDSTQVSEQSARRNSGATTAEEEEEEKNKIRKFQRLRNGFSRTFTVSTIRPQRFKVRLNCECVCFFFANGFQFGTRTLLPGCSPPFNSQQAQRQTGQADCSKQQLEPGGERKGRDLHTHRHTASGHQRTDTPKSQGFISFG